MFFILINDTIDPNGQLLWVHSLVEIIIYHVGYDSYNLFRVGSLNLLDSLIYHFVYDIVG